MLKKNTSSVHSRESSLKPSCANISRAIVKVEVVLDSLINCLKDSLSVKMCYDKIYVRVEF